MAGYAYRHCSIGVLIWYAEFKITGLLPYIYGWVVGTKTEIGTSLLYVEE